MKFLVPNYSCLQNPRLGGYRPQIPVLSVLCPELNLLNPPPNKIPGYATGFSFSETNQIIIPSCNYRTEPTISTPLTSYITNK